MQVSLIVARCMTVIIFRKGLKFTGLWQAKNSRMLDLKVFCATVSKLLFLVLGKLQTFRRINRVYLYRRLFIQTVII